MKFNKIYKKKYKFKFSNKFERNSSPKKFYQNLLKKILIPNHSK